MLKSLSSLVKSRRLRYGATTSVELEGHQHSSLAPPQQSDAANSLPDLSAIHNLRGESIPKSESLENVMKESIDDHKSTQCQQNLSDGDVDLGVNNPQNCGGKKPMSSAQSHRVSTGWIFQRDIENTASTSYFPSECNITAEVENDTVDSTGAIVRNDQSQNSTNMLSPAVRKALWNVPGEVEKSFSPFPGFQGDGKVWKSLEANVIPVSTFSIDSLAECCRVCQQPGEEPLIELGCHCRGELAKAHRSCIQQWFDSKGSNKCEVCQHVATNLSPPTCPLKKNFWVWRLNRPYGVQRRDDGFRQSSNSSIRPVLLLILRRHPSITLLWLFLLVFMTYLFVDVVGSSSVGYAVMAVGFLFGVLVVLGLGMGARLIAEFCHERNMRRNMQRMEISPAVDHRQAGIISMGIH